MITVLDTAAPQVSLAVTPQILWPANNAHRAIALTASASDACDAAVTLPATVASSDVDADMRNDQQTGDMRVVRPNGSVIVSSNERPVLTFDPRVDRLELRRAKPVGPRARLHAPGDGHRRVRQCDHSNVTVTVPHDQR